MGRKLKNTIRSLAAAACAALTLTATVPGAGAAENATGVYLLGSKSSMAGFPPPPGTYGSSLKYYYDGNASGNAAAGATLRQIGNVTLQADVDNWGQTPVSTSFRWMHEFDARNRLEGDAFVLSATIPLGAGRHAAAAAK